MVGSVCVVVVVVVVVVFWHLSQLWREVFPQPGVVQAEIALLGNPQLDRIVLRPGISQASRWLINLKARGWTHLMKGSPAHPSAVTREQRRMTGKGFSAARLPRLKNAASNLAKLAS